MVVVSSPARYMAERCLQCSDLVLGPVGTFVFVLGWEGYRGVGPREGGHLVEDERGRGYFHPLLEGGEISGEVLYASQGSEHRRLSSA